MILRYLFLTIIVFPVVTICYFVLNYDGIAIILAGSFLGIQEFLVLILVFIKVKTEEIPLKVQYLEKKFGPLDLEQQSNDKSKESPSDDLERSKELNIQDMT